jgi:hypothetical protein
LGEGHTYQEAVDLQTEAGGPGAYFYRPEWALTTPMIVPPISLSDNQMQYEHALETGSYALVVGPDDEVWLCGRVEAVES